MKKIIIIPLILILASLIYAVTVDISSFYGQTNPFNITFTGNQNQTFYIDFPLYGYVENVSLTLSYQPTSIEFPDEYTFGYNLSIYHFNGNLTDASENKMNFTADSYDFGDGVYNQSVVIDLVYNIRTISNVYMNYTNNFTIMFWYKTYGRTDGKELFWHKQATASGLTFYTDKAGVDGVFWFRLANATGTIDCDLDFETPASKIDSSNFHHFAFGRNNSDIWFAVDGNITEWNTDCATGINYSTQEIFQIGQGGETSDARGEMDDLIIIRDSINSTFLKEIYEGTFPLKLYSEIGNPDSVFEWEHTLENFSNLGASLNTTLINNILEDGCVCTSCSIEGYYCRTPFLFHSDLVGILTVNLTVANYSYGLDNCSNSYGISSNTTTINFTFKDEENNSNILADIDSEYNYTINDGYSGLFTLDLSNRNNFSLCIYPSWAEISTDYQIFFSSEPEYPQRRYYNDETFTSTAIARNLYLLYAGEGIYVRFMTVDTLQNVITGVLGKMTLVGSNDVIEQEITDGSGLATFFVDPDTDYTFTWTKLGYVATVETLRPTSSEVYTVVMESGEAAQNESIYTGISYNFYPKDTILQNNTNYTFSFNMTSYYWDITGCVLNLKNGSGTILATSSSSYNISVCNIGIDYNTSNSNITKIISEAIWERNATESITYTRNYKVQYRYEGEFSFKNFIDDLSAFTSAGFNSETKLLISFIIIFTIIGLTNKGLGITDPEVLILLLIALTFFFSYINWLYMDNSTIPTTYGLDLKQYIIFIMMLLSGGSYIIWRHQT